MKSLLFIALLAQVAPAAEPTAKPVVGVLYFDMPESGELNDLKKGLAELIITDLVAQDQTTVVERLRLEAVMSELNLQASGKVDPGGAQRIGKLLGARYLVWGGISLFRFEGKTTPTFITKVVVVETGVIKQRRQSGSLDDFFDVQGKMSADAGAMIAEFEKNAPPAPPKRAGRKPSLENVVKYSRALDAKDQKDPEKAKQLLTEVVKEQPDFKLAQLDLLNLSK